MLSRANKSTNCLHFKLYLSHENHVQFFFTWYDREKWMVIWVLCSHSAVTFNFTATIQYTSCFQQLLSLPSLLPTVNYDYQLN